MGLFHAVDWMPTLLTAAGAASSIPSGLDGVAQWTQLAYGSGDAAPRTEILHNINIWEEGDGVVSEMGCKWAALRYGDWKLILHENDLCVRCVCVYARVRVLRARRLRASGCARMRARVCMCARVELCAARAARQGGLVVIARGSAHARLERRRSVN